MGDIPKTISPRQDTNKVGVWAQSSDELARTGIYYFKTKEKHVRGLDINGDPRLEDPETGLRAFARKQKELYADPKSPQFIADVRQREKKIVDAIAEQMLETYGGYSDETVKNKANAGEKAAEGFFSDSIPKLKDMEPGSLVCRHQAVIMSILCHEAGIKNHLVSSDMHDAVYKDGNYWLDPKSKNGQHLYMITDEGNAVVEATVVGKKVSTYLPILNGVTLANIVHHGHAALTYSAYTNGNHGAPLSVYGGHLGDGRIFDRKDDTLKNRVVRAQNLTLERYNDYKRALAELENRLRNYVVLMNINDLEMNALIKKETEPFIKPFEKKPAGHEDVVKIKKVTAEWNERIAEKEAEGRCKSYKLWLGAFESALNDYAKAYHMKPKETSVFVKEQMGKYTSPLGRKDVSGEEFEKLVGTVQFWRQCTKDAPKKEAEAFKRRKAGNEAAEAYVNDPAHADILQKLRWGIAESYQHNKPQYANKEPYKGLTDEQIIDKLAQYELLAAHDGWKSGSYASMEAAVAERAENWDQGRRYGELLRASKEPTTNQPSSIPHHGLPPMPGMGNSHSPAVPPR